MKVSAKNWGMALLVMPMLACSSQAAQGEAAPALLAEATPAARAELEQVISTALHGVPVTIAEDALTRESIVVIERRSVHNLQQPRLDGRKLERPETFRLMVAGDACWLVKVSDGSRWPLRDITCVPAP